MQYLPFLALVASTLAAQSFGVVLIRSGSQYQYALPGSDGKNVTPSGNSLKLLLEDDGSVYDSASKKYLTIGDDGFVTLEDSPQTGYAFSDNYLAHDGSSGFGVLDGKVAFGLSSQDFVGTAWRVEESSGDSASNLTSAAPSVSFVNGGATVGLGSAGLVGIAALLI